MKAVKWLVEDLKERGVEWISTLCGHGLDPIDYAAKQAGLRLVDTRNEQTAAYTAEAAGRLTRRPGVVAVSSGVAHANALTGVVDAWFDGAPMLLITGSHAHTTTGMGHFQDLEQVAMAAPVTKYARTVDRPERTLQILDEAWNAAVSLPPGPVHVTFPMDIQNTQVTESELVRPAPAAQPGFEKSADVAGLAAQLANSERPLIIAGSRIFYGCESESLAAFSVEYAVPLVVPIWDRGSIDRPVETFAGVLGAATGGPRLLVDADLIILAGAACDYRVGYLQPDSIRPDAQVVRLDAGWSAFAEQYRVSGGKVHREWCGEARKRRQEFRQSIRERGEEQAKQGTHAIHIVDALREVIRDDTVLLIDGGSIGQWAHQLLTDRYPGHWLTCGRSGVVGWGLGGAIGARLVYPERPVILLSGDGAFTFNPAEIECAVRQKLPFVAIVADDQAWGITQAGHLRQFGEAITSSLGPVDFVKVAEGFGARGVLAESPTEIASSLRDALERETVTVIQVPIVGGNPA